MHKFIRSLALLASIPAMAPSDARAGDTQIRPNSNTSAVAQQTDTNLLGPLGISSLTASPFWVSDEGSGTATLYIEDAGSGSGVPMTLGIPIPGEAFSNVDSRPTGPPIRRAPAVTAGPSESPLDGLETSFALATTDGPVSACSGGQAETSRPGAGNGLLGILPADGMPLSAVMGAIAVGSLAAAWGWKSCRRPATA